MEHFIDSLSKRLAAAVSRRDMLSIASRALLGAVVATTGVGKLWAAIADAAAPPRKLAVRRGSASVATWYWRL